MKKSFENLNNAICASGGNIAVTRQLLKNKYISKKELSKLLDKQTEYLYEIEKSKNELLNKMNYEI